MTAMMTVTGQMTDEIKNIWMQVLDAFSTEIPFILKTVRDRH